ncbi:DivIVA domain-containing protein [Micromonospora sp. WMMD1082]|uniref:DivIVA domain-containing protein n=1 Tax=Micromonospora sp. WMMD1082 TaxID=3016104 RepID=UPI002417FB57|nr:DivIVA domain-containing protein [Micromonospora sp. WMMD1082]MDG4792948.1 DivIVA domain-containing protein [Micromonospora sp. WMMD1082]
MIYVPGERLHPHHLRTAVFDSRWRGLDADQVRDYLDRVADELERLHRELTTANTETERIRQALRQWQSRHTGCRHAPHGSPNTRRPR